MDLIKHLREELGTSLILITHDLGVVADICDSVAVVYAGQVVEYGSLEDVFDNPSHPYTIGLFGALPDLSKSVSRLSPIDGLPPDPAEPIVGCAFAERCPRATDACRTAKVELHEVSPGHTTRCIQFAKEG